MAKKRKSAKVVSGVMRATYNGPLAAAVDDLPTLKKRFDLASARMIYALQQKVLWERRLYTRSQEFNAACLAYRQKENEFTDAEIQDDSTSTAVWAYAK